MPADALIELIETFIYSVRKYHEFARVWAEKVRRANQGDSTARIEIGYVQPSAFRFHRDALAAGRKLAKALDVAGEDNELLVRFLNTLETEMPAITGEWFSQATLTAWIGLETTLRQLAIHRAPADAPSGGQAPRGGGDGIHLPRGSAGTGPTRKGRNMAEKAPVEAQYGSDAGARWAALTADQKTVAVAHEVHGLYVQAPAIFARFLAEFGQEALATDKQRRKVDDAEQQWLEAVAEELRFGGAHAKPLNLTGALEPPHEGWTRIWLHGKEMPVVAGNGAASPTRVFGAWCPPEVAARRRGRDRWPGQEPSLALKAFVLASLHDTCLPDGTLILPRFCHAPLEALQSSDEAAVVLFAASMGALSYASDAEVLDTLATWLMDLRAACKKGRRGERTRALGGAAADNPKATPETDPTLIYLKAGAEFYNIPASVLCKAAKKKPSEPGYLWSGRGRVGKGKRERVWFRKKDLESIARSRKALGRAAPSPRKGGGKPGEPFSPDVSSGGNLAENRRRFLQRIGQESEDGEE